MIEVMRNETVNAGGYTSAAQVFDTSITVDGSNPTCPQQAATITTLIQILTNTVLNGTTYLYTLPRTFAAGPCEDVRATITTLSGIATSAISTPTSLASVTRTPSAGSCEDVRSTLTTLTALVVNAVTTPASLANVTKTASSGSCEDVRTTINTLFGIVQSAVTNPSSLTNIHRTLSNGSCQNVAGAITSLFQIVTDTISNPGYLQSIERTESPLGLAFGPSVNANLLAQIHICTLHSRLERILVSLLLLQMNQSLSIPHILSVLIRQILSVSISLTSARSFRLV